MNAINRLHIYELFIISLLSDFFLTLRRWRCGNGGPFIPRKNDISYQQNYMQIASAGSLNFSKALLITRVIQNREHAYTRGAILCSFLQLLDLKI